MSWATATADLRVTLCDGPTDRLVAQKKVFGIQNGQNRVFKTMEFRRVTNFSSASAFPLGIYVDGSVVSTVNVTQDDPDSGYFQLAASAAPTDAQMVTATYYSQWFTDTELAGFLQRAADWMGVLTAAEIPSNFKLAALKYAQAEAYQKLAIKVATPTSQGYMLEDAPDESRADTIRAYQAAAKAALAEAYQARDDQYSRAGQAKSPRFATVSGNIKNPTRS